MSSHCSISSPRQRSLPLTFRGQSAVFLGDTRISRSWMATVTGIEMQARIVLAGPIACPYDFLVLATGATHSYDGAPHFTDRTGIDLADDDSRPGRRHHQQLKGRLRRRARLPVRPSRAGGTTTATRPCVRSAGPRPTRCARCWTMPINEPLVGGTSDWHSLASRACCARRMRRPALRAGRPRTPLP